MSIRVRKEHVWIAALLCAGTVWAQTDRASEQMPLAATSLLLDVTLAGDRAVAVGERGHVLVSDDYGGTWRQVASPTRTTLTAVHFTDPQNGWAVGHENVILATVDGGESWQRQFPPGGIEERYLDVFFVDEDRGFAVGAYGFARYTKNGGTDWEPHDILDDELHLNKLSQGPDSRLFLAVEGGELITSMDEGLSWKRLPSPYEGSLFGVLPLAARTLMVYGLRGNVFRSVDAGENWTTVETPAHVLIMHGLRLTDGRIVLAGLNGQFLLSQDGGRTFTLWEVAVQGATALTECPDGSLLAVGLNGAHRLKLPKPQLHGETR